MKPRSRADIGALLAVLGLLIWFLSDSSSQELIPALVVAVIFALLGWVLRGVDAGGAVSGLVVALVFYAVGGGWQFFSCLVLVFALTLVATKIGHPKKAQLGVDERPSGRSASQVTSNLIVPATILVAARTEGFSLVLAAVLAISALAEVAADTVSSEIGEAFGGTPRLITTFRETSIGSDGAVSMIGTITGCVAAVVVAFYFVAIMRLGWSLIVPVAAAGILGMVVDSLLGATLERKGILNNDAVNLLSTGSAAFLAYFLLR
jgi:uncharacterized protein (TIGR00297 family)